MSAILEDNAIILFQGDSITDAGRNRELFDNLGFGYAMMAAAWFSVLYPEKQVQFINRGISGNRVRDLRSRWEKDCLELQPTLISILIGINDVMRWYDCGDATTLEEFENDYRYILTQTKKHLQNVKIIICEPFVLPIPEDRKKWREALDPKINIVRKLAQEFHTFYIPLDGIFARAAAQRPPEFWTPDGVHPTPAGHALIAQEWLKTIKVL